MSGNAAAFHSGGRTMRGKVMRELKTLVGSVALLTGLAVSGCSNWSYSPPIHGNFETAHWNLSVAKAGAPRNPSNFAQFLAQDYVALATQLNQRGDLADTDYFARKAIAAEHGGFVPPEDNRNWAIPLQEPYGFRTQLAAARARLVAALDAGARDRAPALAARAQERYDCWNEAMEDDWQTAQHGTCHNEFLAAMTELEGKPAAMPAAVAPNNLVNVYFDFDKASLSREGRQIVEQLATQLKAEPAASVTVTGKTDLAGTDSYNMALSRRRAEGVATELRRDGIAKSRITVRWTGERNPPVKTAEGVREPRNRVVEIVIH